MSEKWKHPKSELQSAAQVGVIFGTNFAAIFGADTQRKDKTSA
jgi:hypothetical protein